MESKGWENIYKIQGEVQSEVLQVVKEAAQIFKERGQKNIGPWLWYRKAYNLLSTGRKGNAYGK